MSEEEQEQEEEQQEQETEEEEEEEGEGGRRGGKCRFDRFVDRTLNHKCDKFAHGRSIYVKKAFQSHKGQ
jgi:hypothetical protein